MYAEISSAVASVKIALDIARAANSLANYNELVAAVSEVNAKLMDATVGALDSLEKQAALNEEIRSLKEELMSLKNWEREAQDYTLQAVGIERRHFAQVYKPSVQTAKAKHWVCVKCFQDKKLYPLSAHGRTAYQCPNCGNEIAPIIQGGTLAPIGSAYE